jgi:hypothetical protein
MQLIDYFFYDFLAFVLEVAHVDQVVLCNLVVSFLFAFAVGFYHQAPVVLVFKVPSLPFLVLVLTLDLGPPILILLNLDQELITLLNPLV